MCCRWCRASVASVSGVRGRGPLCHVSPMLGAMDGHPGTVPGWLNLHAKCAKSCLSPSLLVAKGWVLDSLAFLGFLVFEECLIYRIDILEGGGKLNAFIVFHEIQAVSPSPPAASYDENFFVPANVPVAQGGCASGGILPRPPSVESFEYFFFGLFTQFQGPIPSTWSLSNVESLHLRSRYYSHILEASLQPLPFVRLPSGSCRSPLCRH